MYLTEINNETDLLQINLVAKRNNYQIKYYVLLLLLIIYSSTFSQVSPDKSYKFQINSLLDGDHVLYLSSEIEITNSGWVLWVARDELQRALPFRTKITGFSKNNNIININFQFSMDMGKSGVLTINLSNNRLSFTPPVLTSGRQKTGFYIFEVLETQEDIMRKKINEESLTYNSIVLEIKNKEYHRAKSLIDNLSYPNYFPNLKEFKSLENEYFYNEDRNEYEYINNLIDKKDFFNASSKIDGLHFPDSYENINEFDKLIEIEIKRQLLKKQFISATNLYKLLKINTNQINLKYSIQETLESYYKDTIILLDDKSGSSILRKYFESSLELHKAEKYKLLITNKSNIAILDNKDKILASSSVQNYDVKKISVNDFIIPVNSLFIYDVTTTSSIINLTKNNVTTQFNDSITSEQKKNIEKKMYPNLIGKYSMLYERKYFNNTFYIDHVNCTKFSGIGGPINIFKSILVPGWGLNSVTGGLKKGWPTTLTTFALFSSALVFKNLSNNAYDNYMKSTVRSDNTKYYQNANIFNNAFYYLTAAGVGVWLFDVIRVSKKGFENNMTRKNTIKNLTFNVDNQSKTFAVGYKIKL